MLAIQERSLGVVLGEKRHLLLLPARHLAKEYQRRNHDEQNSKKGRLYQNSSRLRPQLVKEPGPRPDLAVVIPLQRVRSRICHSKPAARYHTRLRATFAINYLHVLD